MARCWYAYKGIGDPTLSSSYILLSKVKPGCLNGCIVCAIYVPACGITPTSPLPANILGYINDLFSTCVAQPQIPAGTKLFVYGKAN